MFTVGVIEYGAIIWDPHTTDNTYQVERVQCRFLRFKCTPPDYTPVATQLGLASLTKRRYIMITNFLKGPLDVRVDFTTQLSLNNT
ncbi:putative RNA-directed DNA polymerase [Aphis craccivora]|uniref:Putative RNA-directed DNA polymerase n=1 Tax=Aphis craccivora TaxID=307492 RepID=A0A6G0ZH07_APHCR|nr:putative RNA-directed DNA polymerase [Aphis craccivora]